MRICLFPGAAVQITTDLETKNRQKCFQRSDSLLYSPLQQPPLWPCSLHLCFCPRKHPPLFEGQHMSLVTEHSQHSSCLKNLKSLQLSFCPCFFFFQTYVSIVSNAWVPPSQTLSVHCKCSRTLTSGKHGCRVGFGSVWTIWWDCQKSERKEEKKDKDA